MKILVIGGMHGNEPLGIKLVELFKTNKVTNIDSVIANQLAVKANQRYVGSDLNRSFPGDINDLEFEKRRAAELIKLCKNYDIVLDFHNTYCPNNNCSFVGEIANGLLYDASEFLGINRIIVADYDCINKYATNCISIEISMKSKIMNEEYWYYKISELSLKDSIEPAVSIEKYKFIYRISINDKNRLNLQERDLRAFNQIDDSLARSMNVIPPAYPIFINDKFTPDSFGGLLNKC